jgi:hypothetical protein
MPAKSPLQRQGKNKPRQEVCTEGDFENFVWVGLDYVGLGTWGQETKSIEVTQAYTHALLW